MRHIKPVRRRPWPKAYWPLFDRLRDDLELGKIEPLEGGPLEIAPEDARSSAQETAKRRTSGTWAKR